MHKLLLFWMFLLVVPGLVGCNSKPAEPPKQEPKKERLPPNHQPGT